MKSPIEQTTKEYLLNIRRQTVKRIYVALLGQLSALVTINAINKETLEEVDFVLRANIEELKEEASEEVRSSDVHTR